MSIYNKSSASSRQRGPINGRKSYQPVFEMLEDRVTPSIGLFTDDFSNDQNPSLPGYDSFDTDPTTTRPDELQILHLPSGRSTIQLSSTAPSPPHHLLLAPGADVVSFPTPGTPGGSPWTKRLPSSPSASMVWAPCASRVRAAGY
jgi:hypothetical protein